MLRVSKLTDYATVVMTCLATSVEEVLSAQILAERARLETPTVSKVLKQLASAGLVDSWRGATVNQFRGSHRVFPASRRLPPVRLNCARIECLTPNHWTGRHHELDP